MVALILHNSDPIRSAFSMVSPPPSAAGPAPEPLAGAGGAQGQAAQERLDDLYMGYALEEARAAFDRDEVPIGAVLIWRDTLIARAHNLTRWRRDPSAHAEMRAIQRATRATGDLRLPGAVVYTTVEPCFMCAGALVHTRVARVVWGVRDEKFGGCVSLGNVLQHPQANHRIDYTEGVRADEAKALLREFFQKKRANAKRDR